MDRKKLPRVSLFAAAVISAIAFLSSAVNAEPFDKPLRVKVVDFGHSPELMPSDNKHIHLTCAYYPNFMMKELNDPGNEGALWIGISPSQSGHTPPCIKGQGPGEREFKNFYGYFGGVKRNLVVLYDPDGTDGGLRFHIFDSKTMVMVFEDSASLDTNADLDFVPAKGSQITLRYMRVLSVDCSVPKQGIACWDKFRQKAGLQAAPMPNCNYKGQDVSDTSTIAYPVETSLFPKPFTKAVANPVKCYPAD
jgi:hypothetical protein